MSKLLEYFNKNGYAKVKELKIKSFQTRDISNLLEEGFIYKIKPGLYRISEFPLSIETKESYLDICRAVPEAVLYLISALDFHNLTTFNPSEIYIAIPRSKKAPKISYPPVKFFYLYDNFYSTAIQKIKTPYGDIKVYDKEKTICDIFRYRNKLGEDLAIEGLKNYLKLPESDITKLMNYSKKYKVSSVLTPYLKAAAEYTWE